VKVRWIVLIAVLVAGCALATTGRARAAMNCSVTSATMLFGSYDVYAGALAGTGSIALTCSGGGSPTPLATLDAGHGTIADRYMACVSGSCVTGFSSDQLHYNLYTDAGHTTVWGATGVPSTPTGCKNVTCTWTVYGLIPGAVAGGTNDVAVGGYTDSIVVTVDY